MDSPDTPFTDTPDTDTPFTETAWSKTADLRRAIHALPFNCELATGTLSADRFRHYVLQDSLYLRRYSRVLALCAAKAPHEDAVAIFADSALGAIQVEQSMHAGFLERFGVSAGDLEAAEMSPACRAYTDFLVASCYEGSFGVAVAAVLPCFWIYLDVGLAIDREAAADNPFRAWIDTYADEHFAAAVEKVKALADEAAARAGAAERAEMLEAFRLSTEYEFLFWDSAWHQRGWPQHAVAR